MAVRVDTPRLEVLLKKVIRTQDGKAQRFSGPRTEFDLSGWLTDDSSVSISRQINQPSGTFSITLSDRVVVHGQTMDSLYGIVEPMDIIEIRMARRPHEYQQLPLVFRGLVSSIGRDEAMGQDGKPRRSIRISGHDWGKFFSIIQNRYIRGAPEQDDWITKWHLQAINGIPYGVMSAGDTVAALLDKIGNAFIGRMWDASVPAFTWDVSGADPADQVLPQGLQTMPGGTLWDYLHTWGDLGPFYELFIEDEESGPKVIYRKPPFLTIDNQAVFGQAPNVVMIRPDEITRLSVTRSDADVSNWWWVDHRRLMLVQGKTAIFMELSDSTQKLFSDTPNNDPSLYGKRPLEVSSNHGFITPGADKSTNDAETMSFMELAREKRLKLQAANKDNALFESGQMTIAGNEKVKVGQMIGVVRGASLATYYVQGVTHTFQPFRSFTTTVNFIRGTGFLYRSSKTPNGVDHPYLAEIGHGPYESKR